MKSDYSQFIGKVFGRWEVLGVSKNRGKNYHIKLECKCQCGNVKHIDKSSLLSGMSKSCGCADKSDLTGKIIGDFEVLEFSGVNAKSHNLWKVKCLLCGKIHIRARMEWENFSVCECVSTRKAKEETAIKSLYNGYIRQANDRGIKFEISVDDFKIITKKRCQYCGIEPSNICKRKRSVYVYNGLDRIDSEKNYTLDNVVPCCSQCNTIKWDMSYHDFINKIKTIYNHLHLKD